MQRMTRMFEIIQTLRAAPGPLRAEDLATRLEVTKRTIYRDIASLQAMGTPIEGEAGVGYVMRRGYDLPPLNFDQEEVQALRVGLLMLARTGDTALKRAATRITAKIDALHSEEAWLRVAPWGAPPDDPERGCTPLATIRDAIREARKLRLTYRDETGRETQRIVRPVGLVYHLECTIVAAWCELRSSIRHFRTDRVWACDVLDDTFTDQAVSLRQLWIEQEKFDDAATART